MYPPLSSMPILNILNDLPHREHATVLVQAYYNKISAKNQETEDLLVAKKCYQ